MTALFPAFHLLSSDYSSLHLLHVSIGPVRTVRSARHTPRLFTAFPVIAAVTKVSPLLAVASEQGKHVACVQICVMDSRAYAALTPGMETAEELDACTLLVNSQVCACLPTCLGLYHTLLIVCIKYTYSVTFHYLKRHVALLDLAKPIQSG